MLDALDKKLLKTVADLESWKNIVPWGKAKAAAL